MKKIVLVLTGSLNPPTIMHMRMFELARDFLHSAGGIQVLRGIISPVSSGYEKPGLAPAAHRIAMAQLGAGQTDWVEVNSWEAEKPEWTRTISVLKHIDQHVKTKIDPDARAMLLCGADLLESFARPGLWLDEDIDEIVGTFGLAVVTRQGFDAARFVHDRDALFKLRTKITIVPEWIDNGISSTEIRRALRRGCSVRYLVPDPVLAYIRQHSLYDIIPPIAPIPL
eukprot:m.233775 g.233775  ORF g.233775 m.233775 type:complete len:226 (+) comp19295_c0_seq1:116-793(+)